MIVLIDTNIVLDVLLKRQPFYKDAFMVFQLADQGHVNGCLSAASMTDIFYLLRKAGHDSAGVYQIMNELTALFSIAPVTDVTIASALALRWKDFEDAVQFMAARKNGAECIITRNKADYELSDIPCMSATDFIAHFREKEVE